MNWLRHLGPWKRAAEAETRAAVAEERAAQSEQHCSWLRIQFERAEADKDRSTKIMANVFAELHFGMEFRPFPEVIGLPPARVSDPVDGDIFESLVNARDEANEAFATSEMKRREKMYAEPELVND